MSTHRIFRASLLFIAVAALVAPAMAHLGENQTEIAKRLGKGKTYRSRGGWEQREYPKNGLTTYVVFVNDNRFLVLDLDSQRRRQLVRLPTAIR